MWGANVALVVGRRPVRNLWCGHGYEYVEGGRAAAGPRARVEDSHFAEHV